MSTSESLAQQAYNAIKKDILMCKLDPGSQIAQAQLAEQYSFSVTPVREALKRLESEGFVHSVPRLGYIISPITVKGVEEVYEVRSILETSAVRLAIQRASDEQIAHICERANFAYTFKDPESYLRFLDMNIQFHVSIALASGNKKLAEMVSNTLNEMTRIFNLGLDLRDSAEEMRHEHLALAQVVSVRNAVQAEQIIHDQISLSRQRVVEMLHERTNRGVMNSIGGAIFST